MTFETKYNPGDKVWYMSNNSIRDTTVEFIKSITEAGSSIPSSYKVVYKLKGGSEASQDLLFESKAHLISHLSGTEL